MTIAFDLPPDLRALQHKTRAFIAEEILPMEDDPRQSPHGPEPELIAELQAKGRASGLFAPHAPEEYGGLGLDHRGIAVVFEEAGYSLLGALALNIQAPDEGNVNLMHQIATPEQKARWLVPMAKGEMRSVFSLTEPHGAGADPSQLKTTARMVGNEYSISGRKWLITGVPTGHFNIVMARTVDAAGADLGPTMFILDIDHEGFAVERMHKTLDSASAGGHAIVTFDDCRVAPERILGEIGQGFRYAQIRLGPARLTHCMRFLGLARRCHEIAIAYARERQAFGKPIGEHEGIGFQLADNEMDLHACRLMVWHAAWLLDQGEKARHETSRVKVFCSERLGAVIDRSLQVMGGIGITDETIIERAFREVRPFRLFDGPSEVHRWAMARTILRSNEGADVLKPELRNS